MAKAKTEIAFDALVEVVTGTLQLMPVDGDADESRLLTIYKGKHDGKTVYCAECDGVKGAVTANIKAAINNLLEKGLKVLPSVWAVPSNEKDVRFPEKGDNKAREPETFDDLDEVTQAEMREGMAGLQAAFGAYRDAETQSRVTMRALAGSVSELRRAYTKGQWKIFVSLADGESALVRDLIGERAKNTLGEMVAVGGMPAEMFDLVPEGKNSPKSILAWIAGMRSEIAGVLVQTIRTSEDLKETGTNAAIWQLVDDWFASDGESMAFDGGEAVATLFKLHVENWGEVERIIDVDGDGKYSPFKIEKVNATKSLFGTEGADELVNAICRTLNAYAPAEEVAAVKAVRDATARVSKAATSFDKLSADEVARHLFNILACRIDASSDEKLAETTADCDVVLDKMAGWLTAIADGTMTVADVINVDGPKSEGDAEAEADAA